MRYIAILLLLSSCTGLEKYEPNLSEHPQDQEAYETDLAQCRDKAKKRDADTSQSLAIGATGLIGYMAMYAANPDDDGFKSGYTLVDECMAKKGYPLAKESD